MDPNPEQICAQPGNHKRETYKVQDRIDSLTSLRFFAALAIILHHLNGVLWIPKPTLYGILLNQGVSFFFVLSGFILQHSYRNRIGRITSAHFFALRFFRLWPCHIAVLGLLLLTNGKEVNDWYLHHKTAGQLLSATFLMQSWSTTSENVFLLNAPSWSLSTELFFYFLFPLLCRQGLLSAYRPLFIGSVVTGIWLIFLSFGTPNGELSVLAGIVPLARLLEFSIGISLYELIQRQYIRLPSGSVFEIIALALVVFAVGVSPTIARVVEIDIGSAALAWWFSNTGSFWAFAALIAIFFTSKGFINRWLIYPPIVFLGEISFGLYLVHQPVISFLTGSGTWFTDFNVWVQILVFVALVISLSTALHFCVEKPVMAVVKRFFLKSQFPTCDMW